MLIEENYTEEGGGGGNEVKKKRYYIYNIFITNHKWLVVSGSNLNLTPRLLFCPNNNNQKQLTT